MAKFNLKQAKQQDALAVGYHRVMITQVAEVGLQKGFHRDDEPKESIGFCFEAADGVSMAKTMPFSLNGYNNFMKVLSARDEPVGGLRHLIFHAETNGFKSAFKRVGRRILVDEAAFFECVERQNGSEQ